MQNSMMHDGGRIAFTWSTWTDCAHIIIRTFHKLIFIFSPIKLNLKFIIWVTFLTDLANIINNVFIEYSQITKSPFFGDLRVPVLEFRRPYCYQTFLLQKNLYKRHEYQGSYHQSRCQCPNAAFSLLWWNDSCWVFFCHVTFHSLKLRCWRS